MSRRVELHLPADLASVTRARHFVRDTLLGWDLPGLVEDAQLGTSELVANAIRHAGTDLLLTVSEDGPVTIAIQDGQPELRRPVAADADFLAENGRGLHIVAALSSDWGITTAVGGKIVWFALASPSSEGADASVLSFERRSHEGSGARSPAEDHPSRSLAEQARAAGEQARSTG